MDTSSEFAAFLELTGMLFTDPRTAVLLALLLIAGVIDYRTFKIPNWLTGGGLLFALVYNSLVPPQLNATWAFAPGGMLVGLFATLPMYVLRTMGAGDVKLMAMAGAFVGPTGALYSMLFSFVAAGLGALSFAAARGVLKKLLGNVRDIARGMIWSVAGGIAPHARVALGRSVGRLAFGTSIGVGTSVYVITRHFGFL